MQSSCVSAMHFCFALSNFDTPFTRLSGSSPREPGSISYVAIAAATPVRTMKAFWIW